MFTIPVEDILSQYPGYNTSFEFKGDVYPGYYDDILFVQQLRFTLRLVNIDDGIEVVFGNFHTEVEYEGARRMISIPQVIRSFKKVRSTKHLDDIKYIDMKHQTINLDDIIREEIIMHVS